MEASEWLQGYLKDGPKEVSEIREAARREGYTRLQLREAKAICVVRVTNGRSDSSKKQEARSNGPLVLAANGGIGMKESQIEAKLGKMVRAKGGLYYKFVSPGNPGVPDRIVITADGRCIFVELKTEIGRLSALQKWQREELRRRGADVRVLKGMADVEEFAREVLAYAVCPA